MTLRFNLKTGGCIDAGCLDKFGCPDGTPDFVIRRHDTRPALKIAVEDCDGPMDFRGMVIEANMWATAKLKSAITAEDTYFRLVDDIGFEQVMIGDIIVMNRVRLPERMLVTGFDETNKLIQVQRGYHGTLPSPWKKGNGMRIFRILNGVGQSELAYEDIRQVDGTLDKDVITESYLAYEWEPEDTCLPGCYWLEFKVLKMIETTWFLPGGYWTGEVHQGTGDFFYTGSSASTSSVQLSYNQIESKYEIPAIRWSGEIHVHTDNNTYTGSSHDAGSVLLSKTGVLSDGTGSYDESGMVSSQSVSIIPSFTPDSLTVQDFGCILGEGVEWVRRFPICEEGFLVKVIDSPTVELT